jgi:hypothetical protein
MYGIEIQIVDNPFTGTGSLSYNLPSSLTDFSVVKVSVVDVNEAPSWPSGVLTTCSPPSSTNAYGSTSLATITTPTSFAGCFYVPENTASSTVFSSSLLSLASDPDTLWSQSNTVNQTLVYSFLSTNNVVSGSSIFGVNAQTRALNVVTGGSALNFETQRTYILTAQVSDAATSPSSFPSLSSTASVAIYVTDVNENPVISAQTCTVQEQTRYNNAPPGTIVQCNGNGPVLASDPDTPFSLWANLTYSITGGNSAGLFFVNPSTGFINLTSAVTCCTGPSLSNSTLNFETRSSYTLTVTVTDGGGLTSSASVTVNLIDVNEAPVLSTPYSRSISENVASLTTAGTPVGVYDEDFNQRITFIIVSGTGSSIFDIDSCSGSIFLKSGQSLNYEATQSYTLLIRVTDSGASPLSHEVNYTISVIDADDAPIFSGSLSVTLAENSASGATVSSVITVTDPDVFGGNVSWYNQTFAILSGNSQGIFRVSTSHLSAGASSPNSATISVVNGGSTLLNFEDPTQSVFTLLLSSTDSGGASTTGTVTVTLTDVNEAPFFSTSESLSRLIDESCGSTCSSRSTGFSVGTALAAQDPDTRWTPVLQTLTFSLVSDSSGFFAVSTAGQISLTAAGVNQSALDFEKTSSYTLLVQVKDSASTPLSVRANITVTIGNRNEPPVFNSVFSPQPGTPLNPCSLSPCSLSVPSIFRFSVFENATVGTSIGVIVAVDPEDPSLSFAMVDSIIDNPGFLTLFNIDSTGSLRIANIQNLRFESIKVFTFFVDVRDSGFPAGASLSSRTVVRVDILPVNAPPTIVGSSFTIPENSASGFSVGSVASFTSDPNVQTPSFHLGTYSILSQDVTVASYSGGGGKAPFVINSANGAITVTSGITNLDFESKSSYNIVVQIMDNGGLRANATFVVFLTNVNEAPYWASVPVIQAQATILQTLSPSLNTPYAADSDFLVAATGERLSFAITSGNSNGIFSIDSASGTLSVIKSGSLQVGQADVILGITVTDAGVAGLPLSNTTSVRIQIVDYAAFPFFNAVNFTFTVPENAAYGTQVALVNGNDPNFATQTLTYTLAASGRNDAGFSNALLPFPFSVQTIPNAGSNSVGQARISVAWDGTSLSTLFNLNFEARSSYTMTLTATNKRIPPLSTPVVITINVIDSNEAPFFNKATKVPASGFFAVIINENTPSTPAVGSIAIVDSTKSINAGNTSSGGILGFDEDFSDVGKLTYSLSSTAIFSISSTTGVISGGSGSTVLDFETTSVYSLTATITDGSSLFDTAPLTVYVRDVNEVATFAGLYTTSGSLISAGTFSLSENSVSGTALGDVKFIDPDLSTTAFGTIRYSFAQGAESSPFAINAITGRVTLVNPSLIDWEDKVVWMPTVFVTDTSLTPVNTTQVVTINILDANDAVITNIAVTSATIADDKGIQMSSSSIYFADYSSSTILLRAAGDASVEITGTNFGLTQSRLTRESRTNTETIINATYGPTGFEYKATNCAITVPNSVITCKSVPGYGKGHVWRVFIAKIGVTGYIAENTPASTVTSSYYPPSIAEISINGVNASDASLNAMPTEGSTQLLVKGRDFGPVGTPFAMRYVSGTSLTGAVYVISSCIIAVADTDALCVSVPGVGGQLSFTVSIDSTVTSQPFSSTFVRYTSPVLNSVSPAQISTRGTNDITLIGTSFGPLGTTDLVVRYSTASAWSNNTLGYIYTASSCIVTVAHSTIKCTSAEGIGARLIFITTVGGQASVLSSASISYFPASITKISGPGSTNAITTGNEAVYLTGDQFGPVTDADAAGFLKVGASAPVVKYGRAVSGANFSSLSFTALNCLVTTAHTQMVCYTTEGTGSSLRWAVSVGNVPGPVFFGGSSSYAPPSVISYSGPGSRLANTSGNQAVVVFGMNFGPIGSPLDSISYGVDGNDFLAANCVTSVAHYELTCLTVVGAGAQLKWLVQIDGQLNTDPSTDYSPPLITGISGPGAFNAHTDGGDNVIITGTNFATNEWLTSVTYGQSGTENKAVDCQVTVNHTEITCRTSSGTGRKLKWIVTVRGQSSPTSCCDAQGNGFYTSYAYPELTSVSPRNGPAAGGKVITLYGNNLGFLSESDIQVKIDSRASDSNPRPSSSLVDLYWENAYKSIANPQNGPVQQWINSLPSPEVFNPIAEFRSVSSVQFVLPAGYGSDNEIFIFVDGVPSNRLLFTYDAPSIYNLAPDRLNVSVGQLRLYVEGVNFCDLTNGCGRIFVDGQEILPPARIDTQWSDNRLLAIVDDPNKDGSTDKSSVVQLLVGGRWSNNVSFSTPVPAFDALQGQGNWGGGDSEKVESATLSFAFSLNSPSITPEDLNNPSACGPLRESIGSSSGVPASATLISALINLNTGATTTVRETDPCNAVPAGGARRLSTSQKTKSSSAPFFTARRLQGGVSVQVSIDIAAAEKANPSGSLDPANINALMASVRDSLSGNASSSVMSSIIAAVVTATGISGITGDIDQSSFVVATSTISIPAGAPTPTEGGTPFFIANIASIAKTPVSQMRILIGGRDCLNITKNQDGDIGPKYNVPPSSPLASQYYTYRLDCLVPPGVGRDLPIQISTGSGLSKDDPDFRFGYSPPTIWDIVDAATPSISYTYPTRADGTPVTAIPTLGRLVRITGKNFGTASLVTSTSSLVIPDEFNLTVTVTNPVEKTVKVLRYPGELGIVSHDHTSIVLRFPPGQGTGVITSLSVGAQTDTSYVGGVEQPPTFVRYAEPTVKHIFHPEKLATSLSDALNVSCQCNDASFVASVLASDKSLEVIADIVVNSLTTCGKLNVASSNPAFTCDAKMVETLVPLARNGATIGGSSVCIAGSNFGTASSNSSFFEGKPIITFKLPLSDVTLSPQSYFKPSKDHSIICTTLPEGWGTNIAVTLNVSGQISNAASAQSVYTYAPPTVTSITPIRGQTSGLNANNSNTVLMTLTGENLGLRGYVLFVPTKQNIDQRVIKIRYSMQLSHSHQVITFNQPEGLGDDLLLVAVIGGQTSAVITNSVTDAFGEISGGIAQLPSSAAPLFSFDKPEVTNHYNAAKSPAFCTPRVELYKINNKTFVNRTVYPAYPGCFPTQPDDAYVVVIKGRNFGASSALPGPRVLIGGKVCDITSRDHYTISCVAPVGMGDRNEIFVTLDSRSNAIVPGAIYSYDPPVIVNIVPNRVDAGRGEVLQVNGHNFGPIDFPVTVTIGGLPCNQAIWLNDGALSCASTADTVGPKNLTVFAANRTDATIFYAEENYVELRCPKYYYGVKDEYCLPCFQADSELPICGDLVTFPCQVIGADCPGSEMNFDLVTSLPGYWRYNVSDPILCDPLRKHRALPGAPGCPLFVACEPEESCLGRNLCAFQYKDERCATCADRFYRVNGECIKCPNNPWVLPVIFVVVAIFGLIIAHILNSKNVNLALISIGMDWAQVVAMFVRTRIAWPALVKYFFLLLSAFNFNLELIAPECAIPDITFKGKWLFIEALPLGAWLLLCFNYSLKFLWRLIVLRQDRKVASNHFFEVIATGVVVQRVMYMYITRTTLDVYNCAATDPPDYDKNGNMIYYMAWNLTIKCYEPDGIHLYLLPYAFAAMAIYVAGFPILSILWLWKNKMKVKFDQILRSRLSGDNAKTNPNYSFRVTWKALYMNYRPGAWYWEFVINVRKFLIAFCSLMFRGTPSYQLAMALLVLFAAYVLHMRSLPYMSHSQSEQTVRESEKKALQGNVLHVGIQQRMKEDAEFYRKNKDNADLVDQKSASQKDPVEQFYAQFRTRFETQLFRARPLILKNKFANFFFDYNTSEAILLASAILISLAGICFDSSRFAGASINLPGRRAEYDSLAFAIIIVMIGSFVFWILSLITDIALVLAPDLVLSILSYFENASHRAEKAMKQRAEAVRARVENEMDKVDPARKRRREQKRAREELLRQLEQQELSQQEEAASDSFAPMPQAAPRRSFKSSIESAALSLRNAIAGGEVDMASAPPVSSDRGTIKIEEDGTFGTSNPMLAQKVDSPIVPKLNTATVTVTSRQRSGRKLPSESTLEVDEDGSFGMSNPMMHAKKAAFKPQQKSGPNVSKKAADDDDDDDDDDEEEEEVNSKPTTRSKKKKDDDDDDDDM